MNINDFVLANRANSFLGTSGARAPGSMSSAAPIGLQKAEKRIQSEVDVTTTQLSSFGKLKSAVSQAQVSSRALSGLSASSKSADVKTAAENFVSAFNNAINTAKETAAVPGDTAAVRGAGSVGKDLLRAVSLDSATTGALKKAGFSLNGDGNLVLNAKVFASEQKGNPSGLQETLAKIGQQVGKAATKNLASDGSVGVSMTSLNQRSTVLKSQQATLSSLQQQATSSVQGSANAGFFNFGLTAYQNS
jgi:hypothetical protein